MQAADPPVGHVITRLTQRQALVQTRVRQDLLTDLAQQVDALEAPCSTLLCDWLDVEVGGRDTLYSDGYRKIRFC